MEYRYTIPMETPAKKNHRINLKNGRSIPSKAFRTWHDVAVLHFIGKPKPRTPIEKPIEINLIFTHGDKHRRDSDNSATSILDLLKDMGIIEDDCWTIVQRITVENRFEKNSPRCDIRIRELNQIA